MASAEALTSEDHLFGRRSARLSWLASTVNAQEGAFFAWIPVCLVLGIWIYFLLPDEPPVSLLLVVLPVAVGLAVIWARSPRRVWVIALCLVLAGFCLTKLRAEWVKAPVLPATTGEVLCEGMVERVDPRRGNRVSLIVRLSSLTGVSKSNVPGRVRLLARATPPIAVGDAIRVRCRLSPPPAPVAPGAFDYARMLWFEGIGATGRVIGDVVTTDHVSSLASKFENFLQNLRTVIGARIREKLGGDIGAIGEALVVGERAEISRHANSSMQISGLAHVLSISGLHMSLVAGGVFALVRGGLALSPRLALRFPIKKWAACAALLTGFAYLLLSGGAVATQRSYIMLAIMFIAILLDRPALSTRNLALAALLILVLEPEAAVSASFQMSFLAVVGLVSFYDAWHGWNQSTDAASSTRAIWFRRVLLIIAMAMATTLIAGTLSSIPAIYHFGRASPYSLIANLLAMPVIGILIMPMAMASVMLMPVGLDDLPLQIMGEGIRLMLAISDWVSGLPGARVNLPAVPMMASVLLALAALMLCLMRGPVRWVGLGLVPIAVLLSMLQIPPDVLVERAVANVAVRTDSGELAFANTRRGRFAAEKWLQANGEEPDLAGSAANQWNCGKGVCLTAVKGYRVAYADEESALARECPAVDILIARFPLREACDAVPVTIDRFDVWRNGSYALYIEGPRIMQRTSRMEQGKRPWTVKPIPRKDLDKETSDTLQ